MNPLARFNTKHHPAGDCWQWTDSLTAKGYGRFSYNGKAERAHRVSWLLHRGPIPHGMLVCHRCDNPGCVNPEHLFLGTPAANMADMDAKGRRVNAPPIGEKARHAKLTSQQVIAIRAAVGSNREIAERYGITAANVGYIRRRQSWAHVA